VRHRRHRGNEKCI